MCRGISPRRNSIGTDSAGVLDREGDPFNVGCAKDGRVFCDHGTSQPDLALRLTSEVSSTYKCKG
jgi:hypothetical protein